MKKISFVCTTYRRHTCVTRIIEQFIQQGYDNKELIIFNTDVEYPMSLDKSLDGYDIKLINNNIDYKTGLEYTNRGQICRDAVTHANGYYFMLADDDDVYLPWHFEQSIYNIEQTELDAWKPEKSFHLSKCEFGLVYNTMEASVIVKMDRIKEIGFNEHKTGYEGLQWYTKLRNEKQLLENNKNYIPSYCFNWSDDDFIAGHKQSGRIDDNDNFEIHKQRSLDISKEPLKRYGSDKIKEFYSEYFDYINENIDLFPEYYINNFFNKYKINI